MVIAPFCPPHRDTNTAVPDVLFEQAMLCRKSVEEFASDVEFIDTSNDRFDYWDAVASRWNAGEDLIIIEHDIEITADVIPSFEVCDENWCSFQYESRFGRGDYWSQALGCTRFSAELQSNIDLGAVRYQWIHVGNIIVSLLNQNGYANTTHVHGTVIHRHHPLGPGM